MANQRVPSGYAIERAVEALLAVRDQLNAIDPTILEDERLLADMLEGEGGDALAVIDRIVRRAIEVSDFAEMAKQRKAAIGARQARFERQNDALRQAVANILQTLGLTREPIERDDFTLSIRAGSSRVVITDLAELPASFVRVTREPMVREIGAALRAGEAVPGAMLGGNAQPVLTIRTN
jgi:hypothetical protein